MAASPRYVVAQRHKGIAAVTADYALASTTWANLDTTLDLTIEAHASDVLKASVSGLWDLQAFAGYLNVVTFGGTATGYFGSGEPTTTTGGGIAGWTGIPSAQTPIGSSKRYTVAVADVVNGIVTCRLRYRVTGAKTLFGNANVPFEFSVENVGVAQQH